MADLLSIGEFARRSGLTRSALRFYDDCGILRPAVVDGATGYRQYTRAQVEAAELLRECRQAGMPLTLVRDVLGAPDRAEELVGAFWVDAQADFAARGEAVQAMFQRLKARSTMTNGGGWDVEGGELAAAVRQVVPAAAPDSEELLVLRSVLLEAGDDLRLVATDRYRLAIRDLVVAWAEGDPEATALVDAAALAEATEEVPAGTLRVEISRTAVVMSSGEWRREIPTVEGEYPPYRNLVSDQHATTALVDVPAVVTVLEAMGGEPAVVIEFSAGGLKVGVPEEPAPAHVPAQLSGPPLTAGFNPRFLLDALAATEGAEALIAGNSPLEPFLIRSAGAGAFTTRVMPVRPR